MERKFILQFENQEFFVSVSGLNFRELMADIQKKAAFCELKAFLILDVFPKCPFLYTPPLVVFFVILKQIFAFFLASL